MGHIQIVIDENISLSDLKSIIKNCNKKIDEINRHKIYSEKNMMIENFDENFLNNNTRTIIGKFNCEMYISLVDENKKLVEFDVKRLTELLEKFYTYVRIEKELRNNKESLFFAFIRK